MGSNPAQDLTRLIINAQRSCDNAVQTPTLENERPAARQLNELTTFLERQAFQTWDPKVLQATPPLVLYAILLPFSVQVLALPSDNVPFGSAMIQLIRAWRSKLHPQDKHIQELTCCLCQQKIHIFSAEYQVSQLIKKLPNPPLEARPADLRHLVRLLGMRTLAPRDADAIVELLILCRDHDHGDGLLSCLLDAETSDTLCSLLFNPFCIQELFEESLTGPAPILDAKGQPQYQDSSNPAPRTFRVVWSDHREERLQSTSVPPRQKISELVLSMFDSDATASRLATFLSASFARQYYVSATQSEPACLDQAQSVLGSVMDLLAQTDDSLFGLFNAVLEYGEDQPWTQHFSALEAIICRLVASGTLKDEKYKTLIREALKNRSPSELKSLLTYAKGIESSAFTSSVLLVYLILNNASALEGELDNAYIIRVLDLFLQGGDEAASLMDFITFLLKSSQRPILRYLMGASVRNESFWNLLSASLDDPLILQRWLEFFDPQTMLSRLTDLVQACPSDHRDAVLSLLTLTFTVLDATATTAVYDELQSKLCYWADTESLSAALIRCVLAMYSKLHANKQNLTLLEKLLARPSFFEQDVSDSDTTLLLSILADIPAYLNRFLVSIIRGLASSAIPKRTGLSHLRIVCNCLKLRDSTIRDVLIPTLGTLLFEIFTLFTLGPEVYPFAAELCAEALQLNEQEREILTMPASDNPRASTDTYSSQHAVTEPLSLFSSDTSQNSKSHASRILTPQEVQTILRLLQNHASATEELGKLLNINLPVSSQSESRLVLSATASANVSRICEIISDPVPVLLEGPTGVGKSATIIQAAELTKNQFIRFNMSSRIGIDDLLGRVQIRKDQSTGKEVFTLVEQPFTVAFREGYWLLLDEINLAPCTLR
eukprot:TRINITY_DN1156_c0_g1::TRINITY_DN1156_c0_g1_i1::g.17308::m.17308 TRINITY_DN1156_c0_g1::TRINITY_DN1156_c0_g1_i1::g.17308  ORF type:complete len:891 (+),score=125.90,sp/O94248/MDN1_SCHPO/35.83/5e-10,sp/O94248/MDN1_SCHPO/34.02/2e-08,AAA_5/PF07728.9/3.2e-09,AAA_14/PF13173.1/0.0039,Sigma54_activat/PF00158.21/0.028,Biotin_carb_C/PF02785.14/0.044,AAA/PF00004.24/0.07,AAA_16/PF13191.1/1.4e+03,AAA_16/PF13191.1/2.6e+02,AAA_16/PF13191.1/5.3 TRINITY_DN1156_c0_g1_i1:132-2804(+)